MPRLPPAAPGPSRRAALAMIAGTAIAAPLSALAATAAGTAARRAAALARGVNIPDWAGRVDGVVPDPAVLARLRALGFTAIRLPVETWRLDAAGLAHLRGALTTLIAAGFAVDLDLHAVEPSFPAAPAEAAAAAVAAWEKLGPLCAAFAPERVFPELLNEPQMEPARWLELRDRLAGVVRQSCPDHTIVWGASRYQGIWETLDLPPLPGGNDIVAVHYYFPMGFTHQCQSWGDSPLARIRGLPFPAAPDAPQVLALRDALTLAGDAPALATLDAEFSSPWTVARIRRDFDELAEWSARTGTPAIVNEFGALEFCADAVSRANWTRAVREAAEANGIGWLWWELDQGFGFLADRQHPSGFDAEMTEALVGRRP